MSGGHKRKRDELSPDDVRHLSQSLSQLSVSRHKAKKQTAAGPKEDEQVEATSSPCGDTQRYKPDYVTMSDHDFVRMLSEAVDGGDQIHRYLDTKEKIDLIRQMTELTNDLRYLDLQRQFWQDHYDHSSKEGMWGVEVSRSFAKQHRTCRTYSFHKHVIEQRQMTVKEEIHRKCEAFQECLIKVEEHAREWEPSFDRNLLPHAIDEFVKHGQKRLRDEFDYKKKIFVLNATDHYCEAL